MLNDIDIQQTDQLLAESLPSGIIILDEKNNMTWWNHVARGLLKLEKQHLGQPIHQVFSPSLISKLFHGEKRRLEMNAPAKPQTRIAIMVRPYLNRQHLIVLQDVTKQYRLESMRQDFVANISHELRTPLTVFHGCLELLQEADVPQQKVLEMLKQMTAQCRRMERLVEDLLLLSRLEEEQPDSACYEAINISAMLEKIVEDARSLSGDQHHHFVLEVDDSLNMHGHFEELRSAFSNLIYNAVRYTPAQGRITVRWYQNEQGKHLEVEDTGIGIAEKYIPRITQRFYRIDKSRSYKGKGGTGLGLAIVKHVLLRHHGQLSIESELNQGSLFCCSFSKS